jgi:hypothetical protein
VVSDVTSYLQGPWRLVNKFVFDNQRKCKEAYSLGCAISSVTADFGRMGLQMDHLSLSKTPSQASGSVGIEGSR